MLSMSQLQGFNAGGEHDPYLDDVVLLMHFDGNFNDEKGHTVATYGSAEIISSPKYGSGAARLAIANNGVIDCGTSSDYALGLEDEYTIEAWLYPVGVSTDGTPDTSVAVYIGLPYTSWTWSDVVASLQLYSPDGVLYYFMGTTYEDIGERGISSSAITLSSWYHVALVKTISNTKLFVNGVLQGTSVIAGVQSLIAEPKICLLAPDHASYPNTGEPHSWFGRIDEVRVTKRARYTANFTPPTAPFPNS